MTMTSHSKRVIAFYGGLWITIIIVPTVGFRLMDYINIPLCLSTIMVIGLLYKKYGWLFKNEEGHSGKTHAKQSHRHTK